MTHSLIILLLPNIFQTLTLYQIQVIGDHRRNAYQPWYELCDLTKAQKELNIDITDFTNREVQELILEARNAATKRKKSRGKDYEE